MARGQIDQFMNAIAGIESGGASDPVNVQHGRTGAHGIWQIMPENWSPWAREAGLSPNAPRTAENQRRVARHKMLQYYDQYGAWDAVAVAWFAGPGRATRFQQGDTSVLGISDGHSTVRQYVDKLNRTMGSAPQAPGGGGGGPQQQQPQPEPQQQKTHDAGAMLAEMFAGLSDSMAGRDPAERLSFGAPTGRRRMEGATGEGAMRAGSTMMAGLLASLSDGQSGLDRTQRVSFGGDTGEALGGIGRDMAGPMGAGLTGTAGEGAFRAGHSILESAMRGQQEHGQGGVPITDDQPFTIPGGQGAAPSSKGIPHGLQSNASRGAQAARQTLGFDGVIGGIGDRDHGSSDHPHGNAIDLMTHDDKQSGWQMAEWYRQNRDQLGVTYVIFDGKIASPRNGWEWRTYSHPTGRTDPTAMHEDHVHISFRGDS